MNRNLMRLNKWLRYARGASYQHKPQGTGAFFVPGELQGYFNDLRGKAQFDGEFQNGVPVIRTDTCSAFHFPIAIFQWGLANWDLWIASDHQDEKRRENVLAAARWAIGAVSEDGGWKCWTGLERPVANPFSAMAQGQGASLLVRAASLDTRAGYIETAQRAIDFMLNPTNKLTRNWGTWQSLEEYPGDSIPSVLNGWCFALMGIEDLCLVSPSSALVAARELYASGLAKALPSYHCGYWSRYDLGANLASPFYHELHIAQLRALALVFPQHENEYLFWALQFDANKSNPLNVIRAVVVKMAQKLGQEKVGEIL